MKHIYIQPEVLVAPIVLASMILAGSSAPAGDMGFRPGDVTNQW